jgi:crotonobetainyl-CoA:carnitine CoA-transferase CaiB-like acyl-CoA transferase
MVATDREEPLGALTGIRVLDVAAPLGAYVSRLLGDLGADVIKIEPPGGDPGRHLAPFLTAAQERLSLPFLHANLNKRSIVLDLNQPQDQERFRTLAAQADVVVSTENVETWAARGIDLGRLATAFPRLVWTAMTPFGLSGPYSAYVGNNLIAEAMGGLMYIQGDNEKPPCVSPYEQGRHLASLHAAFGTLAALWERQASGRGQVVEVSMQEVVAQVYYPLVRYAYRNEILRRPGTRNPQPANGYYRCQDGHVFLSLFQAHHWDRLVEFMRDPVLLEPAWRDRDYRLAHAEVVETRLQQFAAGFKRWALTEELQRRGIPTAPLLTVADLAANVHLGERHFFMEIEQPPWGRLRSPGPIFRTTAAPLRVWRPAPRLGEHQADVLETDVVWPARPTQVPPVSGTCRGLPLEGMRILDFSRVWAGPYGTRYLADLGAEVIKVESGKFPDGRRSDDPTYVEINYNKRFITLNFQTPAGRELSQRLVAISDVVVENFSPRVMAQYGLDYQHLRAVRPDLIMVSLPGFGQSGPHSNFVSYGGPLMAYTGMALLWGHANSPIDAHSKLAHPDYIAAATLALAVTAALHQRTTTGQGQHIEIAQVEATATAMAVAFLDYFANGTIAAPQGNRNPNCVPQGCYPCLGPDAWCVLSCTTEAQWRALAQLIGGATLADDARFATAASRWQQHDVLDTLISAWTQQCTPHQAMRLLQAVGVPAGVVQTGEDLWRDVHLRSRNAFVTLQHPEPGTVEHLAPTVRPHATPGQIRRPAGRLGEANEAVFCGLLGLSQAELASLVEAGVIA